MKSFDKPRSKSIRVALNRVRRCPKEIQNAEDTGSDSEDADNVEEEGDESEVSSWSGRLWSLSVFHSEDAVPKEGRI